MLDRPSPTFAIAGVDEAGRGPLAGPVTAACVVLPPRCSMPGIADSKKLSPVMRERLYESILLEAVAWAVVSVGPRRIERINIREATRLAMKLASERVAKQLGVFEGSDCSGSKLHLLIDGNVAIETFLSQETIIKGDDRSLAVGAASIVAKVTRDRLMEKLEVHYPGYGFGSHKGYPTKQHRQSISEKGPSSVHRRTFAGVREFTGVELFLDA